MTDELTTFVRGAVAQMGYDNQEPDEELDDQEEGEPAVDAAGWPEGVTAREAFDSLDPDVAAAIADDPELADQWRRALAGENDADAEADDEPGTFAPSGPDLVQIVLANPEAVRADTGVAPEEWLEWAAHAPAAEWAAMCAESGWPVGSRPSRNDLPVAMRWDDEMERRAALIAAGGDSAKRGYF